MFETKFIKIYFKEVNYKFSLKKNIRTYFWGVMAKYKNISIVFS